MCQKVLKIGHKMTNFGTFCFQLRLWLGAENLSKLAKNSRVFAAVLAILAILGLKGHFNVVLAVLAVVLTFAGSPPHPLARGWVSGHPRAR